MSARWRSVSSSGAASPSRPPQARVCEVEGQVAARARAAGLDRDGVGVQLDRRGVSADDDRCDGVDVRLRVHALHSGHAAHTLQHELARVQVGLNVQGLLRGQDEGRLGASVGTLQGQGELGVDVDAAQAGDELEAIRGSFSLAFAKQPGQASGQPFRAAVDAGLLLEAEALEGGAVDLGREGILDHHARGLRRGRGLTHAVVLGRLGREAVTGDQGHGVGQELGLLLGRSHQDDVAVTKREKRDVGVVEPLLAGIVHHLDGARDL